jgi:hypothetical protein
MATDGAGRRRLYRPNLVLRDDGAFEQRFKATAVEIAETETYTALTFGADEPLHILTLTLPPPSAHPDEDAAANVEFNDQGNDTDRIERIELGPNYLRVILEGTLQAGRAKPENDDFEDEMPDEDDELFSDVERFDDVAVSSICAEFELDASRFANLTGHLTRCLDLFELERTGPLAAPRTAGTTPPPPRERDKPTRKINVAVYLDADVVDGFCYGQPWARQLTAVQKQSVLEAIRDLYIEVLRVPADYVLDWYLIPGRRVAGPCFDVEFEDVSEGFERAGEELRFGDEAGNVLGRLRSATESALA